MISVDSYSELHTHKVDLVCFYGNLLQLLDQFCSNDCGVEAQPMQLNLAQIVCKLRKSPRSFKNGSWTMQVQSIHVLVFCYCFSTKAEHAVTDNETSVVVLNRKQSQEAFVLRERRMA